MSRARALVATLWQMRWKDDRISCAVYRDGQGLQLRLEAGSRLILAEPFEMRPRMLARTRALRASLTRRGWQDVVKET